MNADAPVKEKKDRRSELNRLQEELAAARAELETVRQEKESLLVRQQALERALPDAPTNRQACHSAVAAFWANFDKYVEGPDDETAQAGVDENSEERSSPALAPDADESANADGMARHDATQAALAAAHAELDEAQREPPPGRDHHAHPRPERPAPEPEPVPTEEPLRGTSDLIGTPGTDAEEIPESEPELPPETAAQLKLLRRLNPIKSQAQLLSQLAAKKGEKSTTTTKKKWFSWK